MDPYWDINSVGDYSGFFSSGIEESEHFEHTYELKKNLSYSCQYLEFLSMSLNGEIHATLRNQFIKTFVITGMSVVESILYYVIKSRNLHKTEKHELIAKYTANSKIVLDERIWTETTLLRELKHPKEVEMHLRTMLRITEKNQLFGADHNTYAQLNKLRKLRNKIHLYIIDYRLDHDFNNFGEEEHELIKEAMKRIIYSRMFRCPPNKLFKFLIPNPPSVPPLP